MKQNRLENKATVKNWKLEKWLSSEEGLGLFQKTSVHMGWLIITFSSSFRESNATFFLSQEPQMHIYVYKHTPHIYKQK